MELPDPGAGSGDAGVGYWRARCRSRSAHVTSGGMCTEMRFGRARPQLCMSLSGCRLHHGLRGGCAAPEPEAVDGSDPPIRHASYGTAMVGMCAAIPPLAWVAPGPSVPCGKAAATRAGLVPVLLDDVEQPDGQPVGERVLRRLEVALVPPSRAGIAGLGATRGGGAGGAQTRTAPNPQQSLGLPGRSQPRPSEALQPRPPGLRGARPLRATASVVLPVRTSRAPGCASAPHVVFASVCGHDP